MKNRNRYSEQVIQSALKQRAEGTTVAKIAERIGCSPALIGYWEKTRGKVNGNGVAFKRVDVGTETESRLAKLERENALLRQNYVDGLLSGPRRQEVIDRIADIFLGVNG